MKAKQLTIKLVILFFSFFIFVLPVNASDKTYTCNGTSCSTNSTPLFNETNIAPGYMSNKMIMIDNTLNNDDCNLNLLITRTGTVQNPDLADKLATVIYFDGEVYFGSLTNISENKLSEIFNRNISLGTVSANGQKEYNWKTYFETDNGNNYQSTTTGFNFNINFTCGTPNAAVIGATIKSKSSIRTSTFSSEPIVLGTLEEEKTVVEKNENVFEAEKEKDNGNILGEDCKQDKIWWLPLLLQIIFSFFILLTKYIKPTIKNLWIGILILGLLSQILHTWIGCDCITSNWCSRYILLNIFVTTLSLTIILLINKVISKRV